jgi:Protein of unknown function (DUF1493)
MRMRALVKNTLDYESDSWTSFHKMGVEGLDWDSFLSAYQNEFGVELKGLDYDNYFTEGTPVKLTGILLSPYFLVRMLVLQLTGRYEKVMAHKILRTGDLILSVHAGRFVKREQVEILLLPTQPC